MAIQKCFALCLSEVYFMVFWRKIWELPKRKNEVLREEKTTIPANIANDLSA